MRTLTIPDHIDPESSGDRTNPAEYGLFAGYSAEERPLAAYAALVALYHAMLAGLLLAAGKSGRPLPARVRPGDVLLLGAATQKLSRLVSKDLVTSPLRAPFAEYEGPGDAPSEVKEKPRGQGMQRALGELFT